MIMDSAEKRWVNSRFLSFETQGETDLKEAWGHFMACPGMRLQPSTFALFFKKFVYFWQHGSSALRMGFLQLQWVQAALWLGSSGFSWQGFFCCRAQAQQLWGFGLVAPWHVSSSQTRDRTCAPWLGRGILNHCTAREGQPLLLSHQAWEREKHLWPDLQGICGKRGGSHSVSRVLVLARKWVSVVSSVLFSRSFMSDSLWPHGLQHTRPPCPSPTPWNLPKFMPIESVMPSNHLILCCPLLLRPSIFPSNKVFSNESILCIRWPKYWSFSFSIGPSNE